MEEKIGIELAAKFLLFRVIKLTKLKSAVIVRPMLQELVYQVLPELW